MPLFKQSSSAATQRGRVAKRAQLTLAGSALRASVGGCMAEGTATSGSLAAGVGSCLVDSATGRAGAETSGPEGVLAGVACEAISARDTVETEVSAGFALTGEPEALSSGIAGAEG